MVERIEISDGYTISRVIKGGWHLAGGHGVIDKTDAINHMRQFVETGITTFDCADIYTGVEELIGQFLVEEKDAFSSGNLPPVQVHTKYVPDYNVLASLTKADTEKIIDRSLRRLGVERLDLVQFAWWDYGFPKYVETAIHLQDMQRAGKIRHLGITNFDAAHVQELLDAGVELVSNQVQYSVLDQRVEKDDARLTKSEAMPYFCYGVIAGGFLSDKYLNAPEPKAPFENRSLTKYKLIIEEFGEYDLFQNLLQVLYNIGLKHNQQIAEVAAKYILQKDNVAAIIVGARNNAHIRKLQNLSSFTLDVEDLNLISEIIQTANGPSGPFYALERNKEGKHGAIMKYNLNTE